MKKLILLFLLVFVLSNPPGGCLEACLRGSECDRDCMVNRVVFNSMGSNGMNRGNCVEPVNIANGATLEYRMCYPNGFCSSWRVHCKNGQTQKMKTK